MEELEELIKKAESETTLLESPRWYFHKIVTDGIIQTYISFYPKGMSDVAGQVKIFGTSLINQEEIDEACRFIEDNLKS